MSLVVIHLLPLLHWTVYDWCTVIILLFNVGTCFVPCFGRPHNPGMPTTIMIEGPMCWVICKYVYRTGGQCEEPGICAKIAPNTNFDIHPACIQHFMETFSPPAHEPQTASLHPCYCITCRIFQAEGNIVDHTGYVQNVSGSTVKPPCM